MTTIKEFVTTIFDPEFMQADEQVYYTTATSGRLTYPVDEAKIDRFLRGSSPRDLYFGTATCGLTEDGEMRYRIATFKGLWCVVLDDIGSGPGAKCPVDSLPIGLLESASFVVETSPQNFQLGFILDEPLRDFMQAKELVRLVYGAGDWDSGGGLATKWVRLPAGQNTKEKYKVDDKCFDCRLESFNGYVWTPAELLELVDAGVSWDSVVAGTSDKKDPRRQRGTIPYAYPGAKLDAGDVVDPLLEWLQDSGKVLNIRYPIVDIECPWCEQHTPGSPDSSTSYFPLGWGENDVDKMTRGFKCMHGHCADNKTKEFLDYCMAAGGPKVGRQDPCGALLHNLVLDGTAGQWIDISGDSISSLSDRNFKLLNQDPCFYPDALGNWKSTPVYNIMVRSPALVKVSKRRYEPGAELITGEGKDRHLNVCRLPFYGHGDIDQAHVDKFVGFFKYLMPYNDDADWFIRHLAMKVKNAKYRGPGVFMRTHTHGTGRGTMGVLLEELWGFSNVINPKIQDFLGYLKSGVFNLPIQSLWIVVGESKDSVSETARAQSKAYETLKSFVEPAPVKMHLNPKNIEAYSDWVYASTIICSNHFDGLQADMGDRRFKKIVNTSTRESPEYFVDLHAWREKADWQSSVWRYLEQYDCGDYTGMEPIDNAEEEDTNLMQLLSQPPVELAVNLVMDACNDISDGVFKLDQAVEALRMIGDRVGFNNMKTDWKSVVNRVLPNYARAIKRRNGTTKSQNFTHNGAKINLRVATRGRGDVLERLWLNGEIEPASVVDRWERLSIDAIAAHAIAKLDEMGHL